MKIEKAYSISRIGALLNNDMSKVIEKESVKSRGEGNFVKFVAYLQIIGIILVVLGHSFHEYPDGRMGDSVLILKMLQSFRMPLFIFVSGFLMVYASFRKNGAKGFAPFVRSKLKRLLLPYFVLTLITFVPRTFMSGIADDALELTWESLAGSIIHSDRQVIVYYWFIQASFVLLIFSYGWLSLSRHWGIREDRAYWSLFVLFLIMQLFPGYMPKIWALDKIFLYAVFFGGGMLYARYFEDVDKVIPWTKWWFFLSNLGVWIIITPLLRSTDFVSVSSIFGVMMSISAAKWLVERKLTFLDHLMGANYIIFLLSWYVNVVTQQVLSHYTSFPWWVYTLLSLVCGIYIPWLFYRWMQSHPDSRFVRFCALLLGQSLKSPTRKSQ